ncbi:MAG TPA: YetF domain-containing protein [Patescibacteria group bacterium]|nr:YetF domain-containing protein [Patescibacteria group bacterium]
MPDLGSGPVEVAIRTGLVYLFLVIGLRLAGRREVGQMSILDLVVILVIANGVQNAMVGENTTLAGGLISAATLLILDRALNTLLKRNRRLGRILEGEPILIVSGGKVLPEAMRRTRIDRDELDAAVRSHGVASVSDVSLAVVEADGRISVIPRTGVG